MATATDQLDDLLENITEGNVDFEAGVDNVDATMKEAESAPGGSSSERRESTVNESGAFSAPVSRQRTPVDVSRDDRNDRDYRRSGERARSRSPARHSLDDRRQRSRSPPRHSSDDRRQRSRSPARNSEERRRRSRSPPRPVDEKRRRSRSPIRSTEERRRSPVRPAASSRHYATEDGRRVARSPAPSRQRSPVPVHRSRSPRGGYDRKRSRSPPREHEGRNRDGRERDGGEVRRVSGGSNSNPRTENTANRVFVGNLSYDVSWQDLKDYMRREIGDVSYCTVLTNSLGKSKGCGIVEFAVVEDAKRALRKLNGLEFGGRSLFLREDREGREGDRPRSSLDDYRREAPRNVVTHVSDRSRNVVTAVPGDRLEQSGDRYDRQDRDRNVATANFGDRYDRPERDRSDFKPWTGEPGAKVFVANLPFRTQWQDLKEIFRKAGSILRADVLTNPDGRSRGLGTIVFESSREAQAAISMFNGVDLDGRIIEVREDKFANSDRERAASAAAY